MFQGLCHGIVVKSKEVSQQVDDLKKVFVRCMQYNQNEALEMRLHGVVRQVHEIHCP